ncbi:MAG: hydroxypyruvate isomerase, partial [Planctomycetota bacterium]
RMEGDVIPTIREHKDRIGHYHTAGNPGRSNLDDTQELQYAPICKAIVDTGYQGYLGQEFYPKGGVAAIREAVALCDV